MSPKKSILLRPPYTHCVYLFHCWLLSIPGYTLSISYSFIGSPNFITSLDEYARDILGQISITSLNEYTRDILGQISLTSLNEYTRDISGQLCKTSLV